MEADRAIDAPPTSSLRAVLACRLRAERRRVGLSQQQLADRIGVDLRTVQRVEMAAVRPSEALVDWWLEACGARLVALVVEPVGDDHR